MAQNPNIPYRIPMRITNSNGVSAGSTTTFDLPIGFKYLDFQLEYSGVTLAQLKIRHKINGETIREYTGEERDQMNQHDGMAAANGVLVDPLSPEFMKTRDGEEMTGINTGSRDQQGRYISKYTIEIEVDAAATNPALELWADTDIAKPGGPGLIPRLRKFPYNMVAGERQIRDIPKGGVKFARVRRIFIKAATANISRLKVELDQRTHFERSDAVNRYKQSYLGVRDPQTGWYVIDRTEKGYSGDPFNMVGVADFGLVLEVGTTENNVPVFVEYIGGLGD